MDVVFLVGRILFALIFIASGMTAHVAQARQSAEYARSQGAPAPELMVPLSGVVIIAGGLMVALGVWADVGALLLAAFAFSVAFLMHAFWREQDPQTQQNQLAHFMKNMALVGGALVLFYVFNQLQNYRLLIRAVGGRLCWPPWTLERCPQASGRATTSRALACRHSRGAGPRSRRTGRWRSAARSPNSWTSLSRTWPRYRAGPRTPICTA